MIGSFTGPHRFLSNFWPSPIVYKGHVCPTVEHAYQLAKTTDPERRAWVAASPTPGVAKRRGQQVPMRTDWDDVRVDVMRECLRLKFRDPELSALLAGTGTEELVEGNTWGDRFWGVCGGSGRNHLGRLLMEVRQELRTAPVKLSAGPMRVLLVLTQPRAHVLIRRAGSGWWLDGVAVRGADMAPLLHWGLVAGGRAEHLGQRYTITEDGREAADTGRVPTGCTPVAGPTDDE